MLASYQGREAQAGGAVASGDDYDIKVMRREISTIPAIIRGLVESSPSDRARLVTELGGSPARSVVFVGCGDSAFVGQAAVLAFNRQAGRPARAEHALDFSRYAVRYQPEGTVVVAVSYSGKVGRTIEAACQARAFGLPVVALTHDPDSPLGRAADYVVQLDVPTLGFSPGTSTYIAMLTTLLTLAAELGAGDGASDRNSAYAKQLATLSELARETLEMCDESSLVAAKLLYGARMVTYLGAGPNEASARFGAAKLYEGAQQLACATNIEEWAHEQYFTTRPGDPVVLIAPSGAASDRAAEILSELAYVGATTVLISDQRPPGAGIYLPLPAVVEELSPVLAAIPLSLLGFHLVPLNNKRSYNFSSDEAKREHYDTIHRVTIGEPA
jgi:glucosamine--fructose-6-phosphate aminotransferase (isomerizing)